MKPLILKKLGRIPYIIGLCRKRALEGELPVYRQLMEIAILRATRGIGYDIYHGAGMWKKSANWDYKNSFLSITDYNRNIYRLNSRKFHGTSQYKPFEKAIFKQFMIPSADFIGIIDECCGTTAAGKPLRNAGELGACLTPYAGKKICFKLVEGFNGIGFKACEVLLRQGSLALLDLGNGAEYSANEYFELLMKESANGWLLEEYIVQHPVLAAFNPSSLNTIRMFLYQRSSGEIVALRSFFRAGKSGALIDKTADGGASVLIDQETGTLLNGFNWSIEMQPLPQHPSSKLPFAGVQIPFWKEAEATAKRALEIFPETRFSGTDIAITENGPVIIEMNVQPEAICMPILRIQTARIFADKNTVNSN